MMLRHFFNAMSNKNKKLRQKLNLGAGNDIKDIEEWVNHDICYHRPEIEQAWDLNVFPYPWPNNRFEVIKMWDVLEHLDHRLEVLDELWRILKPGGVLKIRAPGPDNKTVWRDLVHRRPFTEESFHVLDPDRKYGEDYRFYPVKKWKILESRTDKVGSVVVVMSPRKK